MKAVEKVMARVNIFDNPDNIFWKLDFTDKYIWEGYRKKDYVSFYSFYLLWKNVVIKNFMKLHYKRCKDSM